MTQIDLKLYINDVYVPYLDNNRRFLVFYGGAGSGKSVFIAKRYIHKAITSPYFRLIYCRKVANSIRSSQFLLLKDLISELGLSALFTIRESTMEIECANGNRMIAHGLDNIEKIKSIQEPTDIWVEEATEVSKQEVSQLNLRLRTKKATHNQVTLSFNPISSEHWIYDSFIVKKEFDADIVKTTYHDNKFLPEAYKAQLEALKQTDENYYKVYCLGEWGGKIKGVIYQNWKLCDHVPQFADYIYGLDFGFNDPTALVKVGIVDKRAAFAQQLIYRPGLTNADLINELKKFNIGKSVIYADNARPEAIEEIYRAGFNIKPCDKGKDSIQNGIDFVKSIDLNILDDSPDLIKELNNYKWAEDKNGNLIESKPVDYFNHALDALRYALHTHLGRPQGSFRISVI